MQNGTSHHNEELYPKIVYHPEVKETQMVIFKKFVQKKYGIKLTDYWELYDWSTTNYPEFWECLWQFFDVIHSQPYTEIFDKKNGFINGQWFKGARLNYAENIFRFRDSHTALIVTGDHDKVENVTYRQMYEEVRLYTAALKAAGIRKGDIVACYMSNKKEAIYLFLAIASIGALFGSALPILGSKAVLARFEQIKPKLLFFSKSVTFNGVELNLENRVETIISGLPSLEKVINVSCDSGKEDNNFRRLPNSCSLSEFLNQGKMPNGNIPELQFEQLPFDHPLNINYTSGTTGKPKALVHSTGSFLSSLRNTGLHQDCTRKDVLLSSSSAGWISWIMSVNTLHLGLTLCVYDGEPGRKSPTHYWDLVDKFGFTSLFIWTKTLEDMEKKDCGPTSKHSLKSLRQLLSMGSPVKPHSYDYMVEKIKPGIFASSYYGSTEFFGAICGLDSNLPVYRGEIQCFALGFDVRCINEKGEHVVGKRGNLVMANPSPVSTIYIFNDTNDEILTETYLSRFPGYWDQSDTAWINPVTRGFIVYGRSDETLLTKGARFGCSEIYFVLANIPELHDYVCVSQYNKTLDERVVLFVKMGPGHSFTSILKEKIKDVITEKLSMEHVPHVILETPDIPYNWTGKKMNLLVKKLVNKQSLGNTEAVANPSSLDFFRDIPELNDFY